MDTVRIKLSALWVSLVLCWFLGDVLRIFSGDYDAYIAGGSYQLTKAVYLGIAILLVIPVIMVFFSLTLPYKANRRANIAFAIFFFSFNLIGLPYYQSAYDVFLIIVGLGFNVLTVWYAWKWPKLERGEVVP